MVNQKQGEIELLQQQVLRLTEQNDRLTKRYGNPFNNVMPM